MLSLLQWPLLQQLGQLAEMHRRCRGGEATPLHWQPEAPVNHEKVLEEDRTDAQQEFEQYKQEPSVVGHGERVIDVVCSWVGGAHVWSRFGGSLTYIEIQRKEHVFPPLFRVAMDGPNFSMANGSSTSLEICS